MSNVASLILYLACFSISALIFYYAQKRDSKVLIGIALSIPFAIAGLRYEVGADYATYLSLYDNLSSLSITQFFTNLDLEVGFYLLVKLSKAITGDASVFFASSSLITLIFFHLGLKRLNVKNKALIYFLFLLIIFPMTLNIVRQGIAMSICFYAFTFMIDRNFRKYLLWIVVASLFHASALFMLPIYLLGKIVKDERSNAYLMFMIKLVLVGLAIFLLLPTLLNVVMTVPLFEKYNLYQTYIGEGNNYTIYIQGIIASMGIIFAKWLAPQIGARLYMFIIMFAILEIIFTTLGFASSFIKRIGLYFSIFNIILLSTFTNLFSDSLGKRVLWLLVIAYGIAYFYLAYFQLGQAEIMPYQSIIGVIV